MRRWPVDGVSYPIAGDIGYVLVSGASRHLTVELNAKALRNLPAHEVSRRVLMAARLALASASCEDGVVELLLGHTGRGRDRGSSGLEPLPGGNP